MKCQVCQNNLPENRTKFCSDQCKSKGQKNSIYYYQMERGWRRKLKLIELLGGKCQSCGYNKCTRALSFHHIKPEDKLFNLDIRNISGTTWDKIIKEVEKCQLLCLNCHQELHFIEEQSKWSYIFSRDEDKITLARTIKPIPKLKIEIIENIELKTKNPRNKVYMKQERVPRKYKIKWPSTEELLLKLQTQSYCSLGRELGVSDNSIRKRIKNHPLTN